MEPAEIRAALASRDESSPFASAPPRVTLLEEESAQHPFGLAVAAAWSCYGGKPARVENVVRLMDRSSWGELDPAALAERENRRNRAARLYADLFAAGHHTTFQHANFVFVLDNVSRFAIWSFFHSHPHYNSEQVSQRYREVSGKAMLVPKLPVAARERYQQAIDRSLAGYRRLCEILAGDIARDYAQVFPARAKAQSPEARKRFDDAIQKRSQEVARYVLPLATPSHLYHTVNALTLLRYHVLANQLDAPAEVRYIVNAMVDAVLAIDPNFLGAPEFPLDLDILATSESLEAQALGDLHAIVQQSPEEAEQALVEFDALLGDRNSRLVSATADGERVMAEAVRLVLGKSEQEMSDANAIAQVLDGSKNPYLGHSLYLAMNSKLMQTMNHITFTFQKRISGAEDAQNQRHRGTPSSSPVLLAHNRRDPDVIIPWAIARNPEALAEYNATIAEMWSAKNDLLDAGIDPQWALYLLPNAHQIRFYESGTLLTYFWKWIKRLCYDAQREIFETANDEIEQVRQLLPEIGRYVDGPPCVMRSRSGTSPICPEGERFCGVPVWRNYSFDDLEKRRIL